MEPNKEGQQPQKTAEEQLAETKAALEAKDAELAALKPKADASSQNFERLKKLEAEKKELEAKLAERGEPQNFDPAKLKQEINDKVDLRVAGYDPEMIEEIESYAKGKNISLAEAAKSPFIQGAVEAIRAKKKSQESTPAPSNNVKVFNGKPEGEVRSKGTPAEKQAMWDAKMKKGVNSNE